MQFYGKAQTVANKLIAAFEAGQIAQPLATVYLKRNDQSPMGQWSFTNQILCLLCGCTDARGFKQWQAVGRSVQKGQKAQAAILIPCRKQRTEKDAVTGEKKTTYGPIYGFKSMAVFDVSQTEGAPLQPPAHTALIAKLPLVHVAQRWGIRIDTFSGGVGKSRAVFYPETMKGDSAIFLGVENPNTFLHELVHAADKKLGNLTEKGQHWRSETVAQLGAAVLAHLIGQPEIADEGKTYHYISGYADAANITVMSACTRVIDRTAQALELILQDAEADDLAKAPPNQQTIKPTNLSIPKEQHHAH